jgi:serine/threonine-protein kinase HipA
MTRTLDVYLLEKLAGQLVQEDDGQLTFTYAESYLANPGALALSHSLPLSSEIYPSKICRGFFSGILPEGEKCEIIARNLGISARNDFSMLERIGGECAGAITFIPIGTAFPHEASQYRLLSEKELANVLRELPRRPLLAGDGEVRLSLAGAQEKMAVYVAEDAISIPLGIAPSTHIIKPDIPHYAGIVHNEALCMRLAKQIGLHVAHVETGSVEGIDFLLVQRYDRIPSSPEGNTSKSRAYYKRIHQEDFCQAMGIASEKKYQIEGGPSIADCFKLLREVSNFPVLDLQRLLDAILFNFFIGNNDAHGKNFSLLYAIDPLSGSVHVQLAPLYDLVCTMYYPDLSPQMAMAIGKYKPDRILPGHFEKMAEECGLSKSLVKKRVIEMAQIILEQLDHVITDHAVSVDVAKWIRLHATHTLTQFQSK